MLASNAALAAGVTIEERAYIGMGALIRGGVTVGAAAMVGMGAVVLQDIPSGVVAAGNPARVMGSVMR